jgi:hypothetical protein
MQRSSVEPVRVAPAPGRVPCLCPIRRALVLRGHPGGLALWCSDCDQSVPFDGSRLPAPCLLEVRRFARQFDHIYGLWLESSEYERWAADELFRAGSALNRLGRVVAFHVSATFPCLYALASDPTTAIDEDGSAIVPACPVCGRAPTVSSRFPSARARVCSACGLLLAR